MEEYVGRIIWKKAILQVIPPPAFSVSYLALSRFLQGYQTFADNRSELPMFVGAAYPADKHQSP